MPKIDIAEPSVRKFHVGERVVCELPILGRALDDCRIVAVLPQQGEHMQYRIRSEAEAFDRMVSEHQLRPH